MNIYSVVPTRPTWGGKAGGTARIYRSGMLTWRRVNRIFALFGIEYWCAVGELRVDLQTLSQRTGIPIRRLRYCLDHNLVPGLRIEISANEAGRPRKFADDVGFGIACAATLIGAGYGRKTVAYFLKGLLETYLHYEEGDRELALAAVLRRDDCTARAELGDGVNVRVVFHVPGCDTGCDTGWVCPGNPAPLVKSYHPTTYIGLDLSRIRDKVVKGV